VNGAASSYDEVPYESLPLPQTHPSRFGAVARLFGHPAAMPSGARVLELGCASGGNLLPMALALPGAHFTGIDLSRVQIEQGVAMARELGVTNLDLRKLDVMAADASLGQFDYVIAHGLFSWVPHEVQEKVLALCRELLAPHGVAYVSYNALPGWHTRRFVRDLMRYHALQFDDLQERAKQARGIVDFVARESAIDNPLLRSEVELLLQHPDSYILHEHLEADNSAWYFHEFMARAAAHGLQYLGEAELGSMMVEGFSPEVREVLRRISTDFVRQEQFMDFLRNRMFRQTLLVHDGSAPLRKPDPAAVESLWVGGPVRRETVTAAGAPAGARTYSGASGVTVTTDNGLTQAALELIGERYPGQIGFSDLVDEAGRRWRPFGTWVASPTERTVLALDTLHCHAAGLLELTLQPFDLAARPGAAPVASTLARAQAARALPVSTLRHDSMRLAPEFHRLIGLLDGSRDREALLREASFVRGRDELEQALQVLAVGGLLAA
jgi:SAM-dependent methyltransferase